VTNQILTHLVGRLTTTCPAGVRRRGVPALLVVHGGGGHIVTLLVSDK
jgi:hypothetical protein